MREGWEVKKLGDVCEKTKNINWKENQSNTFKYIDLSAVSRETLKVIESSDIDFSNAPSRAKKVIEENDVIFATTRPTLNRMAIISSQYDSQICSTGFTVLRAKKDIVEPKYIFYSLQIPNFMQRMEKMQRGASYPAVSDKDVKDFPIPIPPLPEQTQIVKTLDLVFAKLDLAKAKLEQNLHNAKELFESKLNEVFSQRGEGWVEIQFSSLCQIKHGFAFKSQYFTTSGKYVLLTPGNFYESGGYRDRKAKQKYYNGEIPSGFILNKNDLLVAMTEQASGLLGSPILVPENDKFLHNQRLGLVLPNKDIPWLNNFVYYLFNTQYVRKELHHTGTGLKVRHTSPTKIGDLKINYLKSLIRQKEIVEKLDKIYELSHNLQTHYQQKLNNLVELKKSILERAFRGEL